MKKNILAILALVLAFPVWAAPTLNDLERVADAFAGLNVSQYEGHFQFLRVLPDGTSSYVNGDFTLLLNGTIPRLAVDGKQVVDWTDEPLGGLPENKSGSATQFWLELYGWDSEAGRYMTRGWFQTSLLKAGDPITVDLSLLYQEEFVSFSLAGRSANSVVLRIGRSEFGYNASRGGFEVWYDPSIDGDYQIVDVSVGQVIGRGNVGGEMIQANIVNTVMPSGIKDLFLVDGRDDVCWREQRFQSVVIDGNWTPVATYIARAYGGILTVQPNLPAGGILKVYSVDTGERVLVLEGNIPASTSEPMPGGVGKGGGSTFPSQFNIPAGYDHLVVEIIGGVDAFNSSFSFWAYRFGGGKG